MFKWYDHFLHHVIPSFLFEVFAALPFVILICLIYWLIRLAWHKKRLGADFAETRRKCRLNETLRLLLVAWITAIFLLCLIPNELLGKFWTLLSSGHWDKRMSPFGESNMNFIPVPAWILFVFVYKESMSMGMIVDMFFNVILFMPLGIALPIIWRKAGLWKTTLVGFAITFVIEVIVQPHIEREPTMDDLLCNTLGTVTGYLLFMLIRKKIPKFIESCRKTIKVKKNVAKLYYT